VRNCVRHRINCSLCVHSLVFWEFRHERLIDRQTRTWAVLAVVSGVILFVGLEMWETPGMSAFEVALEFLNTVPVVMTSVGLITNATGVAPEIGVMFSF